MDNRSMNYPWYKGIPRQGVKTASSGLPKIQKNQVLMFLRKVLYSNPSINKNYFMFSKIFVRRQTGTITRDTTKCL